ncbi:RagB/SusD family nutrient uptake outer membrane protein [Pedobacter cryoconitis]|uniref:Tetratricopeptide (TPR) repeat protein n=1 Tax=Pedobacter cryoconitis TaxID=188932 RepID=A0A7X0J0Q3_9SPHI|nr:RagB/SusD family nutrient uptake outer membrane protein [Pedobacter cryoconitis]MBB6498944.1 tetratricopeptide (TPR) repeat protein [Pedobacter cryoconitis]
MNRAPYYLSLALLIICMSGCKKFLNVRPDNINLNVSTVEDFEAMLNSSSLATPDYLISDLVSDDVLLGQGVLMRGAGQSYVNAYLWANTVWSASDNDLMYNTSYQDILQMNIILDNIGNAEGGTAQRKEIVNAQARINRAYYYLQLVNLYGLDYQSASAAKDLGVPLILHPDANARPVRATVQQVYDQILSDLNVAVSSVSLPEFGVDVIHPGKASAYALMARTYLYMGNYEKALGAAESALKIKSTLLDYGTQQKYMTLKDQQSNPEILLARVCMDVDFYNNYFLTINASKELQGLLGNNDLRFTNCFNPPGDYQTYMDIGGTSMQFNYSIGVPEMMLIKAECLARSGDEAGALDLVNTLRKYRYKPADYTLLKTDGNKDALTLVLEERRRELFFKGGVRLFDLKRLNREGKFKKDLERLSDIDGTSLTTLPAGSPRYLMPFAPVIIANNPLMIQNGR